MKPILFNTEMVRATLDGRKTQTRRVSKLQFHRSEYDRDFISWQEFDDHGNLLRFCDGSLKRYIKNCSPYGQPGDLLYVREAWDIGAGISGCGEHHRAFYTIEYRAGGPEKELSFIGHSDNDPYSSTLDKGNGGDWRPSIHMPKWAARLFLEITAVRVERLQDMDPSDCIAEGILPASLHGYDMDTEAEKWEEWITLWDSIAKPGEKWDDNPWVWVYEFKRTEAPND
jgi:hypothetical protein